MRGPALGWGACVLALWTAGSGCGRVTVSASSSSGASTSSSGSTLASDLRFCAWYSACEPASVFESFGLNCQAWSAPGPGKALLDCTDAATTCAEFDACIAPPPTESCTAPPSPTCEGDTLVQCSGGELSKIDCRTFLNVDCSAGDCQWQPFGACIGGQCVGNGAPCSGSPQQGTCDGSVVVDCSGGRTATIDCASFGLPLTCVDPPDGTTLFGAGCAGTVQDCSGWFNESCGPDGVITACIFGTTTKIDCKSYGFSGCTNYDPAPGCDSACPDPYPVCTP